MSNLNKGKLNNKTNHMKYIISMIMREIITMVITMTMKKLIMIIMIIIIIMIMIIIIKI